MATDAEIEAKLSKQLLNMTPTDKQTLKQAMAGTPDDTWAALAVAYDNNDARQFFALVQSRVEPFRQNEADTRAAEIWTDQLLNKAEVEELFFS